MTDVIRISEFQQNRQGFVQNTLSNAGGPEEHTNAASRLSKLFA